MKSKLSTTDAFHPTVAIIGIGNSYRGDDSVGLVVANKLTHLQSEHIRVELLDRDTSPLIDIWRNLDTVILIDATVAIEKPGRIRRLDALSFSFDDDFLSFSTHSLGLMQAIELSKVLKILPSKLIIYGIEGENFGHTTELSPAVISIVEDVVATITAEVDSLLQKQEI